MSPLIDPQDQWDEPEKAGDEPKGKEIECPGKKRRIRIESERSKSGRSEVGDHPAKMTNNPNITFFSAENRKVCMWDKNSVGCCTDNLELAHSWHDTGCIGRCSWNNPATLKVVAERGVPFNPSVIYALSDSPGIRNQFNFECPTHHPAIGFK